MRTLTKQEDKRQPSPQQRHTGNGSAFSAQSPVRTKCGLYPYGSPSSRLKQESRWKQPLASLPKPAQISQAELVIFLTSSRKNATPEQGGWKACSECRAEKAAAGASGMGGGPRREGREHGGTAARSAWRGHKGLDFFRVNRGGRPLAKAWQERSLNAALESACPHRETRPGSSRASRQSTNTSATTGGGKMRRESATHIFIWLAALGLILGQGCGARLWAAAAADTVYHNGRIYTMTESMQEAKDPRKAKTVEVVAVKDGIIVFAGSRSAAAKKGLLHNAARLVDLQGKTMLPGLIDGHGHFPLQGDYDLFQVNLNSFPLGEMRSIEDYKSALARRCRSAGKGAWVLGWGYDDTLVAEMRHPTRADLDAACPRNPVFVRHVSGHMAVVNSPALAKAETTELRTVGVDAQSGKLTEPRAMQVVSRHFPPAGPQAAQRALARANEVYAAAGVTTADCSNIRMLTELPKMQQGIVQGNLDLRVVLHPLAYYGTTLASGKTVDSAGWINRAALGWATASPSLAGAETAAMSDEKALPFADGGKAVPGGSDITRLAMPVWAAGTDRHGAPVAEAKGRIAPPSALAEDNRLFLGAWKFTFDGSPQGYTAWMKEPGYYRWGANRAEDSFNKAGFFNGAVGTDNIPVPALETLISMYHGNGQSTQTHTNGSAAAERWVTALEKAVVRHPRVKDTRDTSIHAQTMELQHIQRLTGNYRDLPGTGPMYTELTGAFTGGKLTPEAVGAANITQLSRLMRDQHFFTSYFVTHTYFWGDRHNQIFFGPGRARNMSPAGWSAAYNQPFSFHNDTYITPISPLRSVQSAVTRASARSAVYEGGTLLSGSGRDLKATALFPLRDPQETGDAAGWPFWNYDHRLNALQALRAVTIMPAWQNKLSDRIGSIAPGKLADFTILAEDPLAVAVSRPQDLAAIRVITTIVGDKPAYGFLPGATMLLSAPRASYLQPAPATAAKVTEAMALEPAAMPGAPAEPGKTLGAYAFKAALGNVDLAVFQMAFPGNGGTAREMSLLGGASGNTGLQPLRYSPEAAMTDGNWWIASLDAPMLPLQAEEILSAEKMHIAFFVLQDNGPRDSDPQKGSLSAQAVLRTAAHMPGDDKTTSATGRRITLY